MGAQKGVERGTQVRDLPAQLEATSVSSWPWLPRQEMEESAWLMSMGGWRTGMGAPGGQAGSLSSHPSVDGWGFCTAPIRCPWCGPRGQRKGPRQLGMGE